MDRVTIDDIEWAYEITGSGEPLVLFNGGFLDRSSWLFVAPILAASHRVVTFDLPGHGASTGRIDDPVARLEDIARLIEALELGPVHVHGVSGGGLVALQLAAGRPDLVQSVSVHEPAVLGVLTGEAAAEARTIFSATSRLLQRGEREAALRGFLELVGGDWSLVPPPMQATMLHNAAAYGEWFGDLSHAAWQLDSAAVDAFPGPVLLTRGARSTPWLQAVNDAIEKAFPLFDVAVIDDAGHTPMFEQPARYAQEISSFVERVVE